MSTKKLQIVTPIVTSVNGKSGGVKTSYYVNITNDSSIKADKTPQEIYEAYTAGYSVYAKITFEGIECILPCIICKDSGDGYVIAFSVFASDSSDSAPQYLVVIWSIFAWAVWTGTVAKSSDIPTSIKNPNALKFTGASTGSYDGSEEKTIAIPKISVSNHTLIMSRT